METQDIRNGLLSKRASAAFGSALAILAIGSTALQAAPRQGQVAGKAVVQPLEPSGQEWVDARRQALVARMPDMTAIRLDDQGQPVARLDLYFGSGFERSKAHIAQVLNQFQFDGMTQEKTAVASDELDWRTLVLPSVGMPEGLAEVGFFDPQADLAVDIRSISDPLAMSCSGGFAVNYTAWGNTNQTFTWYTTTDMVVATACPNVSSSADPDVFVAYWNGASYVTLGSSTNYGPDTARAQNSACTGTSFRLRVNMYLAGYFTTHVTKFSAN